MGNDWRIPQNFEDWMRDIEKRVQRQERRLGSASGGVVTGEGLPVRVPPPPGTTPLPTTQPDESPDIVVTGLATGFMVTTEPIDQFTVLDYYIDGQPVTMGTRSTAEFLSTDGDGIALLVDTDYDVSVIARNNIGSAAPSVVLAARLDPGVTDEVVAAKIRAGGVITGELRVGSITLDPDNGLLSPQANGGLVHLPTNGVDPVSLLKVKLSADSADFAGSVSIKGEDNRLEGGMTAANGVTPPLAPPNVSEAWPTPVLLEDFETDTADKTATIVAGKIHVPTRDYIKRYDMTTGELEEAVPVDPTGGSFVCTGGAALVDGKYYILGYDYARKRTYVYVVDQTTHLKTDEWSASGLPTTTMSKGITANGTSTTTVRIVYWTAISTGVYQIKQQNYTLAGALSGGSTSITTPYSYAIQGLYYGAADFGGTRLVIARTTAGGFATNLVYNGTTNVVAENFTLVSDQTCLAWDADEQAFFGITEQGYLYRYSDVVSATSHTIGYSWFDNDATGGTHETMMGPVAALPYTQKARKWMRVSTAPPDDHGGTDDPNSVRIYIDDHLQPDLATGDTTALYGVPSNAGAAPPVAGNFPTALTPGYLRSQNSGWRVNGDGSGWVGPWAWEADGTDANDSGWVTVTYEHGWVEHSSTWGPVQYRKMGGFVVMRGLAKDGTIGSSMFTLPVGFRPTQGHVVPCVTNNLFGRIDVETDGTVTCVTGDNAYVSLGGVVIPLG